MQGLDRCTPTIGTGLNPVTNTCPGGVWHRGSHFESTLPVHIVLGPWVLRCVQQSHFTLNARPALFSPSNCPRLQEGWPTSCRPERESPIMISRIFFGHFAALPVSKVVTMNVHRIYASHSRQEERVGASTGHGSLISDKVCSCVHSMRRTFL
jgi:hypothetical protein